MNLVALTQKEKLAVKQKVFGKNKFVQIILTLVFSDRRNSQNNEHIMFESCGKRIKRLFK